MKLRLLKLKQKQKRQRYKRKCSVDFLDISRFISQVIKKVLYLTKQGFTLITRDGIAYSFDKYETLLFDYSVLSLIFMQAFLCRVIYIIDATDLRVSRRHFVQNLQQYWFVRDKISARAKIY